MNVTGFDLLENGDHRCQGCGAVAMLHSDEDSTTVVCPVCKRMWEYIHGDEEPHYFPGAVVDHPLSREQVREFYESLMKDRARMMDEAKAAQRLECNILFDRYMERAEGLELAMKDLAKAAGLTVCPDCHKICRLETLSGNEYGDGKRRLVFICDDCVEEGPVEIVGVL